MLATLCAAPAPNRLRADIEHYRRVLRGARDMARVVTDGERWWMQAECGEWIEAASPFPVASDVAGE
jgi:hypothetical protein